ncbi:MAG: hypothetical protein KAS04_06565 [Candidatus Aenigmarchaeota archaeon]|nr:hypothetical protein [Candidatus Aenigmarchaeota archaeon]
MSDSSVLGLTFDLVLLLFRNTLQTLVNTLEILKDLFSALGVVGSSGLFPFIVAVLFLGGVLFFFGKFFISSVKNIVLLFIAGFVIILILFSFI